MNQQKDKQAASTGGIDCLYGYLVSIVCSLWGFEQLNKKIILFPNKIMQIKKGEARCQPARGGVNFLSLDY
jgi:hypothetical protein